ncbi:glycosyltransferase family protein [Pseudocnuella soli]|uniref:hypothetical protein n=1 Tax=Pseudocnuella soli TaxID=2502779 RepID=UPI00105384DD|nr:hypothetical protein [Pseudocnuella soli]
MKQGNYILWLPSWYPNKLQPFNGDFVQRHARAVAAFCPVTVFHFAQDGGPEKVSIQEEEMCKNGNLTEFFCYPRHRPTHFKIINQVAFNIRFYRQAKERLLRYFKENGLPTGVHVHIPVKSGNLALWIRKKWGIPFIVSEQSSHYLSSSPDAFINKSPFIGGRSKGFFKMQQWQLMCLL